MKLKESLQYLFWVNIITWNIYLYRYLLLSSKCCIEETFRRDSFTACRASSQLIDLYFIGGKDFDTSHGLSTILQCFFEEGWNFVRSRPRIVLILEEFSVSRKSNGPGAYCWRGLIILPEGDAVLAVDENFVSFFSSLFRWECESFSLFYFSYSAIHHNRYTWIF